MKSLIPCALLFMSIALAPAKETRIIKETSPVLPDNKAQSFTLPNGLTLIVEEDHSAPVASVQAWCGTGQY